MKLSWNAGATPARLGILGLLALIIGPLLIFLLIEHWPQRIDRETRHIAGILILVATSSILSGLLGLAGGTLLIGGLVMLLDLTTAMLLASAVLLATTLWRLVSWRRHADWLAIGMLALGELAAFLALSAIGFVPDKATVLIVLGTPPLLIGLIPVVLWPTLDRRSGQLGCGLIFGLATLIGGAGAALTDMFYQNSRLTRLQSVATKAGMAVPITVLRAVFFGWAAYAGTGSLELSVSLYVFVAAMVLGVCATWLGGAVLRHAVTEQGFRAWNRALSIAFSIFFVVQGIWMVAAP